MKKESGTEIYLEHHNISQAHMFIIIRWPLLGHQPANIFGRVPQGLGFPESGSLESSAISYAHLHVSKYELHYSTVVFWAHHMSFRLLFVLIPNCLGASQNTIFRPFLQNLGLGPLMSTPGTEEKTCQSKEISWKPPPYLRSEALISTLAIRKGAELLPSPLIENNCL